MSNQCILMSRECTSRSVIIYEGHGQSQGQVKVVVGNGSVRQRETRPPRRDEVRRQVDELVGEVADLPADDEVHGDDVTQLMTCDGRGCGHHDDSFRGCDERGRASLAVSRQTVVVITSLTLDYRRRRCPSPLHIKLAVEIYSVLCGLLICILLQIWSP